MFLIKKKPVPIPVSLYLMVLPGVLLTLIYSYGPLMGISIAFQKFDIARGLFGSEWVGLDNFKYIFMLPNMNKIIFNTFYISILKLVFLTASPLIVALMLNEVYYVKFKRIIQSMIYLPHFISWVIVAGIMVDILSPSNGIVNKVIAFLGGSPVFFLGDNSVFRYVIVISDVWKSFGFGTIIYLAALTQIDPCLYESAGIDGANRYHKILHITVPGIVPVLLLVFTLNLGWIIQNTGFDQIVNLYSPVVYETGDVLDTFSFRLAFDSNGGNIPQYDVAAAIGVVKSLVSLTLVSFSYYTANKLFGYKIF